MINYLVTGGLGFIGSHLVETLMQDENNRVWIIDDGTNATWNPRRGRIDYDEYIRDILVQLMASYEVEHDSRNPRLVILSGDCAHRNVLDKIRAGHFRTVFHLASDVSVIKSIEEPMTTLERNVVKTLKIAKACGEGKTRLVFSSSAAVYGRVDIRLPIKEDHSTRPTSPYGLSKLTCENWLESYRGLYDLDYVALRYFNAFGERQQGGSPYAGVIGNWMQAMHFKKPLVVYGSGEQTRDFIHVSDIVRANIKASTAPTTEFRVYNICNEGDVPLNQILSYLEETAKETFNVVYEEARQGEVKRCTGSNTRALVGLDWEPSGSIWDGINKTMRWRGV